MKKLLTIITAAVIITAILSACAKDRPPDDGSPSPEAHNGTFISEDYGSLTFNGDGNSLTLKLTEKMSEITGIPSGKQNGSYVFLFHNESWRYDKAEYFRITVQNKNYRFRNTIGMTSTDTIAFYADSNSDKPAVFTKSKE